MKKIIVTPGCSTLELDTEALNASPLFSDREAISRIHLITEDGEVIYKGESIGTAKAGDIIISFYEDSFPHRCIIVNSEQWKENIETYKAKQEENKTNCLKCRCNDACDACESCCKG